ncbi:Gfo/Idh/MocA family oxidoreductase [Oscillospiraceae bacterium HV4-5-C5C]|nr:Gfo/Idh/MocA family oxidoreductase [Oscillospiraceae bacterium HV4-5-C5C]
MKLFRFAIMGAGGIARKFAAAVKLVPGCEVAAIASKSKTRAQAFADKEQVELAFDDYEAMLEAVRPDCVYIAATTNAHYDLTMLCLSHKVPVLCEKAMFRNSQEATSALNRSKTEGVLAMEAMWSRYLPANLKARTWLEEGRIGLPTYLHAQLGFAAEQDPRNRYFNPDLGGGAAYDLTVYAYELALFFLRQEPAVVQAQALWSDSGVDAADTVNLRFADCLAQLSTTFLNPVDETLKIYGSRGRIEIPHPHMAQEAFLYDLEGKVSEHYTDQQTVNGFTYEIEEARRCVHEGRFESPVIPHATTLSCARLFDHILASHPAAGSVAEK